VFTKPCQQTTEDAFEQAALFLLGLLDSEECESFDRHQRNCKICSSELSAAQEVLALLPLAYASETPSETLKDRILASVTNDTPNPQIWKAWDAPQASAIQVVREHQGTWETVHPGIHVKQLSADPLRNSVTMLIRMDAGSRYIPHRHGGPEQCFVLEGDLKEEDLALSAGDYQYASEGSTHGAQWTEHGCLLLIVCSQKDELLV
jgi:anti-sigma factor ChrR (cupin superfamily)